MLGRGVDQILPQSVEPRLHESFVKDARDYIALAEQKSGKIERPVGYDYVWGDALAALERVKPDLRIINLETSITTSDAPWPDKGIHYRMHPQNVKAITTAKIDACVLANNHVMDWGYAGLTETVRTLEQAGVKPVGAGADEQQAAAPAVLKAGERARVLVFAYGMPTAGVPERWAARGEKGGVNDLPDLHPRQVDRIAATIRQHRKLGDIVVFSIHWGGNWGWEIPKEHIDFAHALIDRAAVDIVHGHSSHHVNGLEVHNGKLILYGCGDFINDYEGIGGHEAFRPDLSLMYFPSIDPATGKLASLRLVPMQIRRLRLNRAEKEDATWLRDTLARQSKPFGVTFEIDAAGDIVAGWKGK